MKILIMVLSYDDGGLYTKFMQTQLETWDSIDVEDIKTYFYYGNCSENKICDNVIHLDISESLENCTSKTLMSFEQIINLDFDYLYRTNSSSYVDKRLIKTLVSDKPKKNFYAGHVGVFQNTRFCSGSGYFLSKDLVELLLQNKNALDYELIDDVSFGNFLISNNIIPTNLDRFDVYQPNDIPSNHFHYRFKTSDRNADIHNMKILHTKKCHS